ALMFVSPLEITLQLPPAHFCRTTKNTNHTKTERWIGGDPNSNFVSFVCFVVSCQPRDTLRVCADGSAAATARPGPALGNPAARIRAWRCRSFLALRLESGRICRGSDARTSASSRVSCGNAVADSTDSRCSTAEGSNLGSSSTGSHGSV